MKHWLFLIFAFVFSLPLTAQNRPKIGLVLGGGGAKGAAEVGVLKVIEEAGIPIDYIAGTSIGSIVGGLYSVGYRSDDLERMFRSQEWATLLADRNEALRSRLVGEENGVVYVLGFPVSRRHSAQADSLRGALKGENILRLLDSMVVNSPAARTVGTRAIPFNCVSVAVEGDEFAEVVLNADSTGLDTCMRASMAIPGAFKPVKLGNHVLVDGGVLNNLPVDVVRQMGADIIIAVDLQQNKHEEYKSPFRFLRGKGGAYSWLAERPDIAKYNVNRHAADIYINPDLGQYGVTSFNAEAIGEMIKRGEKAGRAVIDELKKLKSE